MPSSSRRAGCALTRRRARPLRSVRTAGSASFAPTVRPRASPRTASGCRRSFRSRGRRSSRRSSRGRRNEAQEVHSRSGGRLRPLRRDDPGGRDGNRRVRREDGNVPVHARDLPGGTRREPRPPSRSPFTPQPCSRRRSRPLNSQQQNGQISHGTTQLQRGRSAAAGILRRDPRRDVRGRHRRIGDEADEERNRLVSRTHHRDHLRRLPGTPCLGASQSREPEHEGRRDRPPRTLVQSMKEFVGV